MGAGLSACPTAMPVRVELAEPESASGLADMLHQFLEQTLAADPEKERAARALVGSVVFRAAEDEAVCVTLTFDRGRIELRDGHAGAAAPCIVADFLAVAHLTSGEESALRLLASRRLRVRFALAQLVFLWRVASLLRLERDPVQSARRARSWVVVAFVLAAAVLAAVLIAIRGG